MAKGFSFQDICRQEPRRIRGSWCGSMKSSAFEDAAPREVPTYLSFTRASAVRACRHLELGALRQDRPVSSSAGCAPRTGRRLAYRC